MSNELETSNESIVTGQAYKTAINVGIKASEHILKYWPNPSNPLFDQNLVIQIFEKNQGIGNYATIADKESEDIILAAIQHDPLLKGHRIIAEESDEVITTSDWQWTIDPIDGTPPFRNGLPEFGISIGLLKGQEPIMGVIAMPAQRQLIAARKGHGARLLSFEGKELRNLTEPQGLQPALDKTLIAYDLGYEERSEQLKEVVAKLADKVGYPVSYGSSSTGNFRVAQGLIGAYFCQTPTKFDIGASSAIIKEIGGLVTDMSGKPIDWTANSRSYLAARTPEMHRQILELINS